MDRRKHTYTPALQRHAQSQFYVGSTVLKNSSDKSGKELGETSGCLGFLGHQHTSEGGEKMLA